MTVVEDCKVTNSIIGFLGQRYPTTSNVSSDTLLLEEGIFDSLGVLELMSYLGETYGIEIADEDFVTANFETIRHLVAFVEHKREMA